MRNSGVVGHRIRQGRGTIQIECWGEKLQICVGACTCACTWIFSPCSASGECSFKSAGYSEEGNYVESLHFFLQWWLAGCMSHSTLVELSNVLLQMASSLMLLADQSEASLVLHFFELFLPGKWAECPHCEHDEITEEVQNKSRDFSLPFAQTLSHHPHHLPKAGHPGCLHSLS